MGVEEGVVERTEVGLLWLFSPPSAKVGWVLLALALLVVIVGAVTRRRRLLGLDSRALAALAGKLLVLAAVALCVWGVGGAVVDSGNSMSYVTRAVISERVDMAQLQAFHVLRFFVPLACVVFAIACVQGAFAGDDRRPPDRRSTNRQPPNEER